MVMALYGISDNPNGVHVISLSIALTFFVTVAVAFRFLARHKSRASIAADDWWIAGSLLPFYGMITCGVICEYAFQFTRNVSLLIDMAKLFASEGLVNQVKIFQKAKPSPPSKYEPRSAFCALLTIWKAYDGNYGYILSHHHICQAIIACVVPENI